MPIRHGQKIAVVTLVDVEDQLRRSGTSARTAEWRRLVGGATAAVATPCYVAAWAPVAAAVDRIQRIASAVPLRAWLSFKTHPLPPLAAEWIRTGRGIEVVSESELVTLLQLGCPIDQLLVNGVAKHAWLGRYPLPRLQVHFDSLREVDALLNVSVEQKWRVGVRCHVPDERDARHPGFGGQFGLSQHDAVTALKRLSTAGADVQSVHFHLGQQRYEADAYVRAMAHVAVVCASAAVGPRVLDCGGGLPAQEDPDCARVIAGLQSAIDGTAATLPHVEEIWLENGRYVTGQSAVLAVRVLDIKDRDECRYLICDGGRTNHALAADNHPHLLVPLWDRPGASRLTTICGPTCMTDDRLGRFELSDGIAVGDVLIWLDAGAYHLPWETRFSHGLCAIAWYGRDGRLTVVRDREQPDAWRRLWTREASYDHV